MWRARRVVGVAGALAFNAFKQQAVFLGKLVEDMAETMYAAPGIGLAATQVNVAKRIVVIDTSEHQDRLQVFINLISLRFNEVG